MMKSVYYVLAVLLLSSTLGVTGEDHGDFDAHDEEVFHLVGELAHLLERVLLLTVPIWLVDLDEPRKLRKRHNFVERHVVQLDGALRRGGTSGRLQQGRQGGGEDEARRHEARRHGAGARRGAGLE